ncbi:hypothetical protein E4U54_000689 [Claviceps lovelessii]|nr:hypothetical protein E4U54_000689 [Claviceps lovelessii]
MLLRIAWRSDTAAPPASELRTNRTLDEPPQVDPEYPLPRRTGMERQGKDSLYSVRRRCSSDSEDMAPPSDDPHPEPERAARKQSTVRGLECQTA